MVKELVELHKASPSFHIHNHGEDIHNLHKDVQHNCYDQMDGQHNYYDQMDDQHNYYDQMDDQRSFYDQK